MIGLVDGNNFFVSCERIFDLSLEGKPVAVLSNNDGCVISRSYEFKALDIPMGTPEFKLRSLAERNAIILRSSNYELYGDISRRMIAVLQELTGDVEQYSIDEAFIHPLPPHANDYFSYGKMLRKTILQWVGIPCGIGFAPTKTLAKIANHIAKKSKPGVFVMPDDREEILANLPVSEVWGVGRRLAPKLERLGLRTALQLAKADDSFLQEKFSILLVRTARELRGIQAIDRESPEEPPQSITCSRSFGRPVIAPQEFQEAVSCYTAQAAEKLRSKKQLAAGINLYIQYYPEYEPTPMEAAFTSTTVLFDRPTDSNGEMLRKALPKLKGLILSGRRAKKAGVIFFGLEDSSSSIRDLFEDQAKTEKQQRLYAAMDSINKKFGRNTLYSLSNGIKRPWSMRRERLTPAYTTDWDQLLTVK